jgi:hypothetical protein
MAKTIIIKESTLRKGIEAQLLMEAGLNKSDVEQIVKDTLNTRQIDKELEKKVKKIVAASVDTLFKTLWQRRNFYQSEILNNN